MLRFGIAMEILRRAFVRICFRNDCWKTPSELILAKNEKEKGARAPFSFVLNFRNPYWTIKRLVVT